NRACQLNKKLERFASVVRPFGARCEFFNRGSFRSAFRGSVLGRLGGLPDLLSPPDGAEMGHFNAGGIDHPWGITVYGEDNIWFGNFGRLEPPSDFGGRLTKFWGVNPPPGHNVGDPISPPTGYTLPSAGSEVLLHNGVPLYAYGHPPGPPC